MMNQMVVVVFDSESAALEGFRALQDLHKEGGVSLYASAVVVKDKTGKASVKREDEAGPVGTAFGVLAGSLVDLLGGTMGMPVGGHISGLTGHLFELGKIGVNLTFFNDVSKALAAGKAAVLAEVEESWTSLLDERLGKQGGKVYRRFRVDVVEDQLAREGAALKANLNALRAELKQSAAADRAAIQKDIGRVKEQMKATQDLANANLGQAKAEMEARIKTLHNQAKDLSARTKSRIEKRIANVRVDFEVRSRKLNQALLLAKEALAV